MSALSDDFSFNLVEEPWIPVLAPGGGFAGELSLREIFARAHELQEISTPSPLTTVSLYRLLIAVIHAATDGPVNVAAWRELWERGRFDMGEMGGYLDRWKERFDLFHPRHPFYQRADLESDYSKWIVQIVPELPVDGGAIFLEHVTPATLPPFTPAQAARALVTAQTFSPGGLISLRKGENPLLYKSADGTPLMKCVVTLVRGDNLFETLLLNVARYSHRDNSPVKIMNGDRPAWERNEPTDAEDRLPDGYRDLLTWQSRRARLIPERLPSGAIGVSRSVLMKGNQFPDTFEHVNAELMVPFRRNNDPKAKTAGWLPLTLRSDRALWRDSTAIFQQQAKSGSDGDKRVPISLQRPAMFDWLARLYREGVLPMRAHTLDVEVFGVESDRANLSAWRQETLPLPPAYLVESEIDLTACLEEALALAEDAYRVVQGAVERYAEIALAPMSDTGGRQADREKGVKPLREAIDPGSTYWPMLEAPFLKLLRNLPNDRKRDLDGEEIVGRSQLNIWREVVRSTAIRSMRAAVSSGGTSARVLKARAAAERRFRYSLRNALEKFEHSIQVLTEEEERVEQAS